MVAARNRRKRHALPPLPIVIGMPPSEFASRLIAICGAYGAVTHATSRAELLRCVDAMPADLGALWVAYSLPGGSPLRIVARFTRKRPFGSATVFCSKIPRRTIVNAIAGSGALFGLESFPDETLRTMATNSLHTHHESLVALGIGGADKMMMRTIGRWKKRFGLSVVQGVILLAYGSGHSPWAYLSSLGHEALREQTDDLLQRLDAEHPLAVTKRLDRETFGSVPTG